MTAGEANGRVVAVGQVTSYKDLRVWQTGMDLAEACYRLTRGFPQDEVFALTSQVRRAAISIPANIAKAMDARRAGTTLDFCASHRAV